VNRSTKNDWRTTWDSLVPGTYELLPGSAQRTPFLFLYSRS